MNALSAIILPKYNSLAVFRTSPQPVRLLHIRKDALQSASAEPPSNCSDTRKTNPHAEHCPTSVWMLMFEERMAVEQEGQVMGGTSKLIKSNH